MVATIETGDLVSVEYRSLPTSILTQHTKYESRVYMAKKCIFVDYFDNTQSPLDVWECVDIKTRAVHTFFVKELTKV